MLPVAWVGLVPWQLPENVPGLLVCKSKLPGSNVTVRLPPLNSKKNGGWGLLPVTVILSGWQTRAGLLHTSLTNRVPGVPGVPGVAAVICQPLLLTLFADLWSHESDTELSAPTVSQSAFCLVSCFRIESANTVCMFVVDIPVTNAVAKRTNTTKV